VFGVYPSPMARPSGTDFNPYAPPTASPGDGVSPPVPSEGFRSATPLAQVLTVLLILYGVAHTLRGGHNAAAIVAMQRVQEGVADERVELEAINQRDLNLKFYSVSVYLASVVSFGRWMFRTNRNVHTFGLIGPAFTPGWAVGVFFVPIWNLYGPYQAMREIWHGSNPNPDAVVNISSLRGTPLLKWWWGLFLGSSFRLSVFFHGGPGLEAHIAKAKMEMVGFLVDAVAAVLAIVVVRSVAARQDERQRVSPAGLTSP
jgi:hypothetical protein